MKTGKQRYLAYHREKELCDVGRADGIKFLHKVLTPIALPEPPDRPQPVSLLP